MMAVESVHLGVCSSLNLKRICPITTLQSRKRMVSLPQSQALALHHNPNKLISFSSLSLNPLRFSVNRTEMKKKRGYGAVCYAVAPLTARNLQWIATISSAVLMVAKGTAIQKSFLVPLFALLAPASVISFIKGDYGIWAAFLALLVRLFFFIPGELELPFAALLLVIVAPYQVISIRGTQPGAILSLVIAAYLVFQHFSRVGSLRKAFEQGSIVATLAIVCITAVSCLLLI